EEDTLTAADQLAKLGVVVHTVGIGDPTRGALIPVQGLDGTRKFLKFQGELVRTKLEEEVLRHIARRTRGKYIAAGTAPLRLDQTFDDLIAQEPLRELTVGGQGQLLIHRFQWFLAAALVLLLLEMLLSDGRRRTDRLVRSRTDYFRFLRR